MQKLGVIGRWAEFPPTGMMFEAADKAKTRTIVVEFNTTARVAVTAQEVGSAREPNKARKPVLVGVVDGLAAFEFRVAGDVKLEIIYLDDHPACKVWFATDEGRNYAIDSEHLRDFAVPMVGRRERNPEMDAFRFEMKQTVLAQQAMFAEWMKMQTSNRDAGNGKGYEAKQPAEKESADAAAGGGSGGGENVRPSSEVGAERGVPAHSEIQGAATEGDPDRSAP